VWASLLLYRQILDEIEANDYDNFTDFRPVNAPSHRDACLLTISRRVWCRGVDRLPVLTTPVVA